MIDWWKDQQPSCELFSLEIVLVVKEVYDTQGKMNSEYKILTRKY